MRPQLLENGRDRVIVDLWIQVTPASKKLDPACLLPSDLPGSSLLLASSGLELAGQSSSPTTDRPPSPFRSSPYVQTSFPCIFQPVRVALLGTCRSSSVRTLSLPSVDAFLSQIPSDSSSGFIFPVTAGFNPNFATSPYFRLIWFIDYSDAGRNGIVLSWAERSRCIYTEWRTLDTNCKLFFVFLSSIIEYFMSYNLQILE